MCLYALIIPAKDGGSCDGGGFHYGVLSWYTHTSPKSANNCLTSSAIARLQCTKGHWQTRHVPFDVLEGTHGPTCTTERSSIRKPSYVLLPCVLEVPRSECRSVVRYLEQTSAAVDRYQVGKRAKGDTSTQSSSRAAKTGELTWKRYTLLPIVIPSIEVSEL